jgi:DNA-binding Lrp family transcriptional regulator
LEQEFHIDLAFCLKSGEKKRTAPVQATPFAPPRPLEEGERRLVMALQEGLPFFIRPFAILAQRVGCEEGDVLDRIRRWCAEGIIKRFGVVVRHHELGFKANAMLVQNIPDADVERVGNALAQADGVTLCYRRPRVLPDWPYNLFCMIHGQAREEVETRIAALRAELGLAAYPHEILFSLTRFKQTGARYA